MKKRPKKAPKNLPCSHTLHIHICNVCLYIFHFTIVLRAIDLDTNTIQCSIFIYCWKSEREREVIASCVCDCVRLLFYAPRTYIFINLFNSFLFYFSGANFNISIEKLFFLLLLNLNEFLKVFFQSE